MAFTRGRTIKATTLTPAELTQLAAEDDAYDRRCAWLDARQSVNELYPERNVE
jgi:hypothetical protein